METAFPATEKIEPLTEGNAFTVKGYGATGSLIGGKQLQPMDIQRHRPQADELLVEILYCGVCHSDIHQVANDWKNTIYPCVPGHEIVGRVIEMGADPGDFKPGDVVGIGCMINSCQECLPCQEGEEQYCQGPVGPTMTYNGYFKPDGSNFNSFGGFSTHIVVKTAFVLRIPDALPLASVAPILCAGVTTYSPLKRWDVQAGDRVGIIGIGGLGHMAVMLAKAMGAQVTAITTKEEKRAAAVALGADDVLVSEDEEAMAAHELFFDYLLCTIPESFDVNPYVKLLNRHGSLVTVGLLGPYQSPSDNMELAKMGRTMGGSLIGGIAETQEVLEFCADNDILPQVEIIQMDEINDAFKKIREEEVRFRYVIDMQSFKSGA